MTKEKILEIMEKHWHQDGYYTVFFGSGDCADELLKLLEQEEEEIFKNTLIKLIKFFNFNQNETEASYSMNEIQDVIREFAEINEVEL